MSRTQEKDRRAERRKPFALALMDDHLAAIGQVALRGGMLDNLIELTAEQKAKVRSATGKDAESVELSVEELEERIAPKKGFIGGHPVN